MSLATWVFLGIAVFFFLLARAFRKTLKDVESPRWTLEKPPLPKDLAALVLRLDRWKAEGRIGREEYERLMHLCQEDAESLHAAKS